MDKFVIFVIKVILWFRYRITVNGLEKIIQDERPIFFVANHPSLSDPLIVISLLWKRFKPRAMVRDFQINRPGVGRFVQSFRPIAMPDMRGDQRLKAHWVRESISLTAQALQNNENVLIWPAGKLSRDGYDYFINRSAAHQIFNAHPQARLVALRSCGLWGSRSGWYNGPDTPIWKIGLLGLIFIPLNLFCFMPKRHIEYDIKELVNLKNLDKIDFNIRLQDYFNAKEQQVQITPLMWWNKKRFLMASKPRSTKELLKKEKLL